MKAELTSKLTFTCESKSEIVVAVELLGGISKNYSGYSPIIKAVTLTSELDLEED